MDDKQIIDPGWSYHRAFGYSQAVRAGGLLFLAGQMPVDTEGAVVADGDIRGQTRQTFENIKAVLAAAGASLEDIVDMTSYHTDMADLHAFMEVKGGYLTGDLPAWTAVGVPAWTAVGVPALALPGQMIEIKVVALARS